MKYLFLDVDGVLNTRPGSLDENALMWLRIIVLRTGCKLVLSSTWRKADHQRDRLYHALLDREMYIHSLTPILEKEVNGLIHARPRWEEIEAWMCVNFDWEMEVVILDDDDDFGPLKAHHVRTDCRIGLTQEIAEEVIRRLNAA